MSGQRWPKKTKASERIELPGENVNGRKEGEPGERANIKTGKGKVQGRKKGRNNFHTGLKKNFQRGAATEKETVTLFVRQTIKSEKGLQGRKGILIGTPI